MLSVEELEPYLAALDGRDIDSLPLYGVPFAIKDNIDLAGIPTTAACPAFAYVPERSATIVEQLLALGAIPLGKTNLDQFATGLNGSSLALWRVPQQRVAGVSVGRFQRRFVAGGGAGRGEFFPGHRHRRAPGACRRR